MPEEPNKSMVDRADLIICAVERKCGGAWTAVKYADDQGKEIINLVKNNE